MEFWNEIVSFTTRHPNVCPRYSVLFFSPKKLTILYTIMYTASSSWSYHYLVLSEKPWLCCMQTTKAETILCIRAVWPTPFLWKKIHFWKVLWLLYDKLNFNNLACLCYTVAEQTCLSPCRDPERREDGPQKIIGFLSNTCPDPQENHKITKPAFNAGPSLAR